MRILLGVLLVLLPFIVLFITISRIDGIKMALMAFGLTIIFVTGTVLCGVVAKYFITGGLA